MTTNSNPATNTDAPPLVITRMFDAPREMVWKAWTDPDLLVKWWGPHEFTSPMAKIDLRVGGRYINAMQGADGQIFYGTGLYREVVPMEKLVYTDSFGDEQGNVVEVPGFPLEMLVTLTFEDTQDGKTKMTLTHVGLPAGEINEMTQAGWNQSFDKLADSLR